MQPIVVIGAGLAGYSLIREYRKLNTEQDVLLICLDDARNYSKPTLSNAFAQKKQPSQLTLADPDKMAEQLNIRIQAHASVEQIDPAAQTITYQQDGQTKQQPYSKLVLALGAHQIRLPIEGDAAQDIFTINSLMDYEKFRDTLDALPEKRVLIIGAGLIGCEFANDLLGAGCQSTVVDLAPQVLGRLMPEAQAQSYQQALSQAGIQFELGTTVKSVNHAGQAYRVELANGKTIEVDLVLSAVGLRANIDLAKAAGINTNRAIVTNRQLQTSQANIYALGDCSEVVGHHLPFILPIMQQARTLAKVLSGEDAHIHYPAMPVAVKTPAAPLTILPPPLGLGIAWQVDTLDDGAIVKAIDAEGILQGFILLGATAGKQRFSLAKQVPDVIPPQP